MNQKLREYLEGHAKKPEYLILRTDDYYQGYFNGQTNLAKVILENFFKENTDPKEAA